MFRKLFPNEETPKSLCFMRHKPTIVFPLNSHENWVDFVVPMHTKVFEAIHFCLIAEEAAFVIFLQQVSRSYTTALTTRLCRSFLGRSVNYTTSKSELQESPRGMSDIF